MAGETDGQSNGLSMTADVISRHTAGMRQLGERIAALENGQALSQASTTRLEMKVDTLCQQVATLVGHMDKQTETISDHEVRIREREWAYEERIKPALEQLDKIRIDVTRGALYGGMGGGGIISAFAIALGILGKAIGWW